MPRGTRKVTVATIGARDVTARSAAVEDTLRSLRSLGIRFSVERIDGRDTTISAWLETRDTRMPELVTGNGAVESAPPSVPRQRGRPRRPATVPVPVPVVDTNDAVASVG